MAPVAAAGARFGIPAAIAGSIFGAPWLVQVGVLGYLGAILLHFLTLPVEFDASKRALAQLEELGMLRGEEAEQAKKTLRIMGSNASDEEKFEALGVGARRGSGEGDGLLGLLADHSIDPQTGALLGRFIAEERDSGRLLQSAYKKLKRNAK